MGFETKASCLTFKQQVHTKNVSSVQVCLRWVQHLQHRCPKTHCSPLQKRKMPDRWPTFQPATSLNNACTRLPSQTSPHCCSSSCWEKAQTLQQLRALRPLQRSWHLRRCLSKDTLASKEKLAQPRRALHGAHSLNICGDKITTSTLSFKI